MRFGRLTLCPFPSPRRRDFSCGTYSVQTESGMRFCRWFVLLFRNSAGLTLRNASKSTRSGRSQFDKCVT